MYEITLNPDNLFFTSDTHFGHFKIAEYCNRPFKSRKDMNEALIQKWNEVVPEDGIVIHCGDFTLLHDENLGEYEKLASRLNGKILLVRGNHDRVPLVLNPDSNSKFIAIVDIAILNIEDVKIIASHFPLLAYPSDFAVFGHIHTLSNGQCHGVDGPVVDKLNKSQYDVGVDQNNYAPISYQKLLEIFKNRRDNKYHK